MNKRTILAILLTAAVWIVWFAIMKPDSQTVKNAQKNKAARETVAKGEVKDSPEAAQKTVKTPAASITKSDKNLKEETVTIETETFRTVFTSKGAAVKEMVLKEGNIPVTVPDSSMKARGILDFAVHFNDNEFLYGNDLDSAVWKTVSKSDKDILFATELLLNGLPLEIQKHYTMNPKGDSFTLEYVFINRGRSDMSFPGGSVIVSPADMIGPKLDYENRYNIMKGIYSLNGSYKTEDKGSGFFSKSGILKKEPGAIDWVGVSGRYILVLMLPSGVTGTETCMDNRVGTGYRTGMSIPVENIKAGAALNRSFTVYVGEKDKKRLEAVDPRLKGAADITMIIEPIRYFVLWCLLNLNRLFGNIGWSLVVFSLLTKIAFMPLTKKSTDSMKKMQALSPKINELKAKYKDKPDVMQKEMMKLYGENKVNPLSGCLPILLQMPFFFALYSALINSIDLWNAPFIFWIKDLSMPDTVATISGFSVNILPILMTISTFFQQKLTTVDTGQSQQQKIMMMTMPVVFIFIFWTMPSGLVLYWTLQNVFQVANQLIVNRFGKEKN